MEAKDAPETPLPTTYLLEIAEYLGEVQAMHRQMETDLQNNLDRIRQVERKLAELQRRMKLPVGGEARRKEGTHE